MHPSTYLCAVSYTHLDVYKRQVLKERNKNIIIFVVTSYSEYLDEAMRFHVFRYLSKPLEKQRLFRNLKDACLLYTSASLFHPILSPARPVLSPNRSPQYYTRGPDSRLVS